MTDLRQNVIQKSVSMYDEQWAIVDQIDNEFTFGNTSFALRHLVNTHGKLRKENERLQQANAQLRATIIQLAKDAGIDTLADLETYLSPMPSFPSL